MRILSIFSLSTRSFLCSHCPVAAVSPHHGPETLALLLAAGANPNILSASCGLTARQEAMQGAMNDPALMANLDVFTIFEAEVF